MEHHETMGPQHHMPEAWLVDYAAGTLDEANALLVACHAALCPTCRETLRLLDATGGALLEETRDHALLGDAQRANEHRGGDRGDDRRTVYCTYGS